MMLFICLLLKVSLPKDVDITMDGVEAEHIGVDRPTSPIPVGKIQAPGQGTKLYSSSSSYSHFRMGLTPTLHSPAFWYEQAHAQHWAQSITTLSQINPFKYLQPSATKKKISTQRTRDTLQRLYWFRYTWNLNSMFVINKPKGGLVGEQQGKTDASESDIFGVLFYL